MSVQRSEAIQTLIKKARIVSFESWRSTHSAAAIALFQAADDQARYLTDEDLQQIQTLAPSTAALIPVVQLLRDRVTEIVDEARSQVLSTFPTITQPGGSLYPPERADACWRDFWHFLRCMTYGIAGQQTHYTSPDGLAAMQQLYQTLQVPLDAMIVGLEGIKTASLKRIDSPDPLAPYFDHLIAEMSRFQTDGLPQSLSAS